MDKQSILSLKNESTNGKQSVPVPPVSIPLSGPGSGPLSQPGYGIPDGISVTLKAAAHTHDPRPEQPQAEQWVCGNCGLPTRAAKFCPNCGAVKQK